MRQLPVLLWLALLVGGCQQTPDNTGPAAASALEATGPSARSNDAFGPCGNVLPYGAPTVANTEITLLCEHNGATVFFASGYSLDDKRSIWSAYELNAEKIDEIENSDLDRDDYNFVRNPALLEAHIEQPTSDDYKHSGYQRGHYAPAESMRWAEGALQASFYVTNIAPQHGGMNGSLWRCLEASIREWAKDWGEVYVIAGGYPGGDETIGSLRTITVPTHYYAIIYRPYTEKVLAVSVPNKGGFSLDTRRYFVSIESIEEQSGLQFSFPAALEEAEPNAADWPVLVALRPYYSQNPDLNRCVTPSGSAPIAMIN